MIIDPKELQKADCHILLLSSIIPRPIMLIATVSGGGIFNVAPYSSLTSICAKPTLIGFQIGRLRDGRKKDTLRNIEEVGDFSVNLVTKDISEAMNQASAEYPFETDEFQITGLKPVTGEVIRSPLVDESPVKMECKRIQILSFGDSETGSYFVIGEVIRFHIKDDISAEYRIDSTNMNVVGRLGGGINCLIGDTFEMDKPSISKP